MARRNNPRLGTIDCPDCGGVASVHQTARGAGRYLYTRCGECGPDQRTGAQVQSRIWNRTTWDDGPPDVAPPNLAEPAQQPGEEPKPGPADPAPEPETTDNDRGGLMVLGAAVLGFLALMKGGR